MVKRRIIQIAATLLMNFNFSGFPKGKIYQGVLKKICVPGLNCYSCPGALGACPIGSLQALSGNLQTLVSFYIYGFLFVFGLFLGRVVCGFLCPFGFIQELLNKIPLKNWCSKKCFRYLAKLKYVILFVMVIGIPTIMTLIGKISFPAFCEYLCPAGTLEAGIPISLANGGIRESLGWLFVWKVSVMAIIILLSIKIFRPFCRFLCPLGAVYALFNRISILHIKTDKAKCDNCNACRNICDMEARNPDDIECIRCGKCIKHCPQKALYWSVCRTLASIKNGAYER